MRGKSKLTVFAALMLILSMFLAACSGGSEDSGSQEDAEGGNDDGNTEEQSDTPQYADNQELRVNILSEPPSLDPATATDTTSSAVLKAVFEGLTRGTPDGEYVPAQAEDIQVSDDGLTYTVTLRDDIQWSNGDPVTAEDFEYAWKHVLDPETADTDYAYQLYVIKNAEAVKSDDKPLDALGVEVLSEKELEITLENPTPYFMELLAFPTYFPVNKEVAEEHPKWYTDAGPNYVTNGAFTLEKWEHKDQITMKKNEDYWDAENVHLETIQMFMIDDGNTELSMFENGELDWAGAPTGSLPLAATDALKQSGELTIHPIAGVYYLSFNIEAEPFTNKKVRKAFSLAMNRQALIDNVLKRGQLPAMALVPPSIWEENEEGYYDDNNVERAKQLLEEGLDELGWSKDELNDVTLSYNKEGENGKIMQAVQEMWNKAFDISLKMDNAEWKVYLDKLSEGNYQVGRMGWLGDFNDAINFLEIFRTVGGNNYTNWEDEEFKKLLDESAEQTDPAERKETLKKAEDIFMEARPIAPLYFYTHTWVKADYLKDVYIDGLGNVDYKWAYIEEHDE